MRRGLVLAGIVAVALALAGLVTGVIGAEFRQGGPLLPAPEIHLAAPSIVTVGPVHITNTILSSWFTTILLVVLFWAGTRRMSPVPGRLQSFVEAIVEQLHNFVCGVVGRRKGRRFLPLVATIFLFVGFNAWVPLLPFYPAVGALGPGGHVEKELLRKAATDLNMPLALALISGVMVEYWGLRFHGLPYLKEFVRVGQLGQGLRHLSPRLLFMGAVDAFVGVLELLSHGIRIVSFTFRLFGNMLAGEILLLMATFLVSFVVSIAFYGLELLAGFVQALIFAGLTLAFIQLAVASHEEEEANGS